MKFEDYKEITTDQYGFQFVKNNIMIGNEETKCLICGSLTKYIVEIPFIFSSNSVPIFSNTATFLSNYGNNYICHKHNGGCSNVNKCKEISKKEKNKRD